MSNFDIASLGDEQRIVLMNGGLGNQLCQYFFLRWMEIKTGKPCIASDYEFCIARPEHNGYELKRIFNLSVNRLSQVIPPHVWQDMMYTYVERQIGICQQLWNMGYPVTMVAESTDFAYDGNLLYMNSYAPLLAHARGFLYFHGYWIHNLYFKDIQEELLKELQFPMLADEKNKKYAAMIKGSKSVCIHIRRGDFISLKRALPMEIYPQAVKKISELDSGLTYFVFSDDIAWCKANLMSIGLQGKDVVFVEGNKGEQAYVDMQLMAMCQHRIVSNSSFSYLAALLREDRQGIILSLGTDREFS